MAEDNELTKLKAQCEAIHAASRRSLGLMTVASALAAPVLAYAGMVRERRKNSCACSLPNPAAQSSRQDNGS